MGIELHGPWWAWILIGLVVYGTGLYFLTGIADSAARYTVDRSLKGLAAAITEDAVEESDPPPPTPIHRRRGS